MTTLAHALDTSRLAVALLPYTEYPLRRGPDTTSGVFIIDLHIRATRLQQVSAPLQALQLAFDAASLAALHPDVVGEIDAVRRVLDNPDIALNVIWAAPGSLRVSMVVNPLTPEGRNNLRIIFAYVAMVLELIPGAQALALGFALALELGLQLARYDDLQHPRETVPVGTIDEEALRRALVNIGITPPDKPWRPPVDDEFDTSERG